MILGRYIFSHTLIAMLVTLGVLTGIVWLTQSLRFLDFVVYQGISVFSLFQMIFFLLPDIWMMLLPLSFFIGILVVFDRFSQDGELQVLRTIGLTPLQFLAPIMTLATLCSLFLTLISFWLLPLSFQKFRALEFQHRTSFNMSRLQAEEFIHLPQTTLYVKKSEKDGMFSEIFIFDERHGISEAITAENGVVLQKEQGTRVILSNGFRSARKADSNSPGFSHHISLLRFDKYLHDLEINQKQDERIRKPSEMFFSELLGDTSPRAEKLFIETHNRLTVLLFPFIFSFVALTPLMRIDPRARRSTPFLKALSCVIFIQVGCIGLLQSAPRLSIGVGGAYLFLGLTLALSVLLFYRRAWGRASS